MSAGPGSNRSGLSEPRLPCGTTPGGAYERQRRYRRPGDGGRDPEQRVSGLAAAMLRIGKSLDLETVLREVLEGARALTGAQCGVITTVDETGKAQGLRQLRPSTKRRTGSSWNGKTGRASSHTSATFPRRSGSRTCIPSCTRSASPRSALPAGAFPGNADAPPRYARRQLLPLRQGGGRRVHRRRRGGPDPLRRPGGSRDRQRPRLPRRAAGEGRPRGAGGHLSGGGHRLRCTDRPSDLGQPGNEGASWSRCALRGRPGGRTAGKPHLPARRRTRVRARPLAARRRAHQRRAGAGRGDPAFGPPTAAA